MTDTTNEKLEGIALTVYSYVVQANKPVGIREVTRGANISSTSVTYRHLIKLEDLGLIRKDEYGNYVLNGKTNVNGHVWVGRSLVPFSIFFSLFFLGGLSMELVIILLGFIFNLAIEESFFFLTMITGLAAVLFMFEGRSLYRKTNKN
jgi:hypothetical protein